MDRAFHSLTIRTLDEGKRIIEGWATTGRTDRVGDIVEPLGSEFDLPLPLLLDHDHSLAVGEVEKAEVTTQGIRFVARIKKIDAPGKAKELTDMAWHYAASGLRRCVSIGFQPLEFEPLPTGGLRYLRWSWYELSLCSVPANPAAVIDSVKHARISGRVTTAKASAPKFVSAADRRKQAGGIIVDERRHVRRARAALVQFMGEKNVPRFQSLAALERWDDKRQLEAIARGAICITYDAMVKAAPKRKALPVVRLRP
jgi:hypothetical protein